MCPHKVIQQIGNDTGKQHPWGLGAALGLFF